MVGNAFACSCGESSSQQLSSKKVLVLEASSVPPNFSTERPYSNRVSAISPGSKALFQKIGAWDKMERCRLKPVNQLQVWESCSQSRIHYEQPDFESEVAYIVENDLIVASLSERIDESCPNVTVKRGARVKNYRLPESLSENVEVDLEDGSTIECRLLIGADGANSLVRKATEVHTVSWDYGQKGVVATLRLAERCKNDVAWQRFTPSGPVALLPLTQELTSLVWTTSNEEADKLMGMDEERFTDKLNEAIWDNGLQDSLANTSLFGVSRIFEMFQPALSQPVQLPPTILATEKGSRGAFPLGFSHATHYVRPRVALIGDAAHRVHPLAGQGVNLGFGDVVSLTKSLEKGIACGADIGALDRLADYEKDRQMANIPVMATVDFLNRLYSNSWSPLVILRSLGLDAVNRIQPLKDLIMKQASG